MELQEWLNRYPEFPPIRREENLIAIIRPISEWRGLWDLYHLSDYAVTTVSGIVIWLVKRQNPSYNRR